MVMRTCIMMNYFTNYVILIFLQILQLDGSGSSLRHLGKSGNHTRHTLYQPSQQQRSTCVRAGEFGQSEQCISEITGNDNCLFQMTFGNIQNNEL